MAENKPKPRSIKHDSWLDEIIRFKYKNKPYEERLRGVLVLKELGVGEIKKRLNEIPGKFAFWKAMQEDVLLEIEEMQENFDIWNAGRYEKAADAIDVAKPTETAIKNRMLLDNTDTYRKKTKAIRDMKAVERKLSVITTAFNHQIWTLSKIAGLTVQEMNALEPHSVGRGSLKDIGKKTRRVI